MRNNFGRNIILQNLFQINMGASSFLTGSGANLLAASLIAGAIGSDIFFSDWMIAAFPGALILMILGWIVGSKIIFPIEKENQKPSIEGGMDALRVELKNMGIIKGNIEGTSVCYCINEEKWVEIENLFASFLRQKPNNAINCC